ncbi:hypothetical protein BD413DRAFT_312618 [Trametes elegans]|nr:hypothetical protein BD413DRAFT_312618 [Trametes elegans]
MFPSYKPSVNPAPRLRHNARESVHGKKSLSDIATALRRHLRPLKSPSKPTALTVVPVVPVVAAEEVDLYSLGLPLWPNVIDKLPTELLIRVFDYLHVEIFEHTLHHKLRAWFNFLHVCGRWRSIALSIPRYWRVIPIGHDHSAFEFFLARCGDSALLDILFGLDVAPKSLALLKQLRERVRLLDFTVRDWDGPVYELWYWGKYWPVLEDIRLWSLIDDHRGWPYWTRNESAFPRLQTLRLYINDLPTPLPSGLRILELHGCRRHYGWDNFIGILRDCPSLVELYLDSSLPESYYRPWPSEGPIPSLPRLRVLDVMEFKPCLIHGLLARLEIPCLTRLRLVDYGIRTNRMDYSADGAAYPPSYTFKAFFPRDVLPRLFPDFTSGIASATLSVLDGAYVIIVRSSMQAVTLSASMDHVPDWSDTLVTAFRDLLHLFSTTPIGALEVRGRPHNVPPALWAKTFRSLHLLETLTVKGRGSWRYMWQGLANASASDTVANYPCCPHLRAISIGGTAPSKGRPHHLATSCKSEVQYIQAALQGRAERGAKLQELRWDAYRARYEDPEELEKRIMEEIGPVVERVVYKDLGTLDEVTQGPVITSG